MNPILFPDYIKDFIQVMNKVAWKTAELDLGKKHIIKGEVMRLSLSLEELDQMIDRIREGDEF